MRRSRRSTRPRPRRRRTRSLRDRDRRRGSSRSSTRPHRSSSRCRLRRSRPRSPRHRTRAQRARSPTEIGGPDRPCGERGGIEAVHVLLAAVGDPDRPRRVDDPGRALAGQSLPEHPEASGIDPREGRLAVDRPDRAAAYRHLAREGPAGRRRSSSSPGRFADRRARAFPECRARPIPPLRRPPARSASGCSA